MVRRIRRVWLIAIGVATLSGPSVASGQIFARPPAGATLPEETVEGNVSCGLMACPPNAGTFGVYHEHWRRWPEESTTMPAEALSPFARPRSEVPAVRPPDTTHEESLAPPRRGLNDASAPTSAPAAPERQPSAAPPPPPPAAQPPTVPVPDQALPAPAEDRPSPLDEPMAPPSGGGFFPSAGESDSGELPDDLPDTELDGVLPPADLDAMPPSQPPAEPPQDDADDIFDLNLDDFGRADPRRLQRYRLSSTRQLRRTDGDARSARAPAARSSHTRPPVQLAGYRRSTSRSNPLRGTGTVVHDAALHSAVPHEGPPLEEATWQAEPARFESIASEPVRLSWSEPAPPPRRDNPLR